MPFNPFRTSRPRMTYIPDPFGRVGQGEWRAAAARDPFGRVAADDPDDAFDFSDPFHPAAAVGARGRNAPNDVANLEGLLRLAGDMDLVPTDGPTGYFGARLDDAIRAFQRRNGLTVDSAVHPGGETLRALARHLQVMGRNGDTVLAHLTPEEARYLHAVTDGGTVNPRTGLLEFFDNSKKKGSYIWRTVGDGKVRSSHADRNGKVFSWANPPEGGHPGEAPNCRCWAEEVADAGECKRLKRAVSLAQNEVQSLKNELKEHEENLQQHQELLDATWDEFVLKLVTLNLSDLFDGTDGFWALAKKILSKLGKGLEFEELVEAFGRVSKAQHDKAIAQEIFAAKKKLIHQAEERLARLRDEHERRCRPDREGLN
ncbi:MAG: hypothetical protein CMM61_00590 [Rhodospirillaceae bacterium]|nr:hypothetical protein [Rhodospirillaceae bacterium]